MQQQLHLMIVDVERRTALAARYGARWLFPSLTCHERARAGPVVARWCTIRGLAGDIAGQWLGRVEPNGIDWLIALRIRPPAPGASSPLEWIGLDALLNGSSVIDYQSWALTRCLQRHEIPAVRGPFGHLDWPERVRAWIAEAVGSPVQASTAYRLSAYEVVLGVETAGGLFYFKGLTGVRRSEALLTRRLASLVPESFAATLATEDVPGEAVWWLTADCRGRPSHDMTLVGAALARIQQRLTSCVREWHELPVVDLGSAAFWATAGSGGSPSAELIRDACNHVLRDEVPRTWIPMDLDPSTVLVDDPDVRFIDMDDSFAGPAPLAPAAFARRCAERSGYHEYAESWSPPLAAVEWRRYEVAAVVFQAWRGWESLRLNVARGAVFGSLDRLEAVARERLVRSLQGR